MPKFEQYELGSQIRRATDSTLSNIVEGYGRRRYKADFVRFLIHSHATKMEANCLLERLIELFPDIIENPTEVIELNDRIGRKLNKFIQYVEHR